MKGYTLLKTKSYTSYYKELNDKDAIIYVPGFASSFKSEKKVFVDEFLDKSFSIVGLIHPGTGYNLDIKVNDPNDVREKYLEYFKEVVEYFNKKNIRVHFLGVSMGGMIILDDMVGATSSVERGLFIASPFSGRCLRSLKVYKFLDLLYISFKKIGLIFIAEYITKSFLWWPYILLGLMKNKRFSMKNFKNEIKSWKKRDLHNIIVYMRYIIYHEVPKAAENTSNKRTIYFSLENDTRIISSQCIADLESSKIDFKTYSINEYLHSMDLQTKLLVRKYKSNILTNLYEFINKN